MEKTLRVLGGGEEGHSHSHSHSHANGEEPSTASASGVSVSSDANGLKNRKSEKDGDSTEHSNGEATQIQSGAQPSKLSAYLNLFGDFVHNM